MSFPRQLAARQTLVKLVLAVAAVAGLAASIEIPALARSGPAGVRDAVGAVDLSTLPPEAQETQRQVWSGGPFPYEKDGSVFLNRERHLPAHTRGYYREYTVRTPGAQDRGARRIVCGGDRPKAPEACFYTADHYTSFRLIVQ